MRAPRNLSAIASTGTRARRSARRLEARTALDQRALEQISARMHTGVLVQSDGAHRYANRAFLRLFGFREDARPEEIDLDALFCPAAAKRIDQVRTLVTDKQRASKAFFVAGRRLDGTELRVELAVHPVGWKGAPALITTVQHAPINNRGPAAPHGDAALAPNDWSWEASPTLFISRVDGQFKSITGLDQSSLVGSDLVMLLSRHCHPDYDWRRHLGHLGSGERIPDWHYRWVHENGIHREIVSRIQPIHDEQGKLTGYRGVERDVTEHRRDDSESAHHSQREVGSSGAPPPSVQADPPTEKRQTLLETMLESMTEGMCMVSKEMRLVAMNSRFVELLGLPQDIGPGDPFEAIVRHMALLGYYGHGDIERSVAERLEFAREFPSAHFVRPTPDGRVLEVRSTPVADGGFIRTYVDVSEAHRLNSKVSFDARHDTLTGLVNRKEIEERVERLLSRRPSRGARHAFGYLDLDQFKVINETCGHTSGDRLLLEIADVLRAQSSPNDTLGRMGGDEFGLLMPDTSPEAAYSKLSAVRAAIEEHRHSCSGNTFKLSASIGLVAFEADGRTAGELLSSADAACYTAKDHGRNRIHTYHHDDHEVHTRFGEMAWVSRITKALDDDRFSLFVQSIAPTDPQMESNTGARYEVLLRMHGDNGDIISPTTFLPAAERYNLASRIDHWVINALFDWLQEHRDGLDSIENISVNLSGASIGDESLLNTIIDLLAKAKLRPGLVCFEITETTAIARLSRAREFIQRLQSVGCKFALDDFGAGLSSFSYLRSLPFDILKIDGAFIENIHQDPVNFAMVKSINDIGHALDKTTVAEFV
ncbi:MAG: EAL domain-containing protein, partial [Gammaproteobacteria bacterium]|nr:EAL domain-containing protein [Gammaproteobacteria bacterium]